MLDRHSERVQSKRNRRHPKRSLLRSRWLRAAIAVSTVVAVGTSVATAPALASDTRHVAARIAPLQVVARRPALPFGAHAIGALTGSRELSAAVSLKLRNPVALTSFIDDASNPRSTSFRRYLAAGQFASRFGPSKATIAAVERALTHDGLKVTGLSSNGILIQFKGSVSLMEAAFHTDLESVRLANGSLGQATTTTVRLPSSIAPDVQAVVGLDQLVPLTAGPMRLTRSPNARTPAPQLAKSDSPGAPAACPDALAQQANGALTDQQIANAYGVDPLYSTGDLASGQTIDVYELEPFEMSDISAFDQCYFGQDNTSNITVTTVDGGPGTGYGSAEAALDIEDVSAIAPDAKIDVFEGPNMDDQFGPLDTWNQIAIADNARQVTSSWGVCAPALEQGAPGVEQVENEIFEQMAAQGQTVFSAAGDDGSDSCAAHNSSAVAPDLSVLDPADQPYVTSVGGTTMLDATDPPTETVWNNGNDGGAGGGGISTAWAQPPWQSGVAVPQTPSTEVCSNDPSGTSVDDYHVSGVATNLPSGTLCRETPDVSALADPQTGVTIFYGGGWFQIGGTSSATPLWAAMLAEINASSACADNPDGVGFVDPALYQIAADPTTYADAFNDVTAGDNDNLGVGADQTGYPFYAAGTGYDLASGLGTPQVTNATQHRPRRAAVLRGDRRRRTTTHGLVVEHRERRGLWWHTGHDQRRELRRHERLGVLRGREGGRAHMGTEHDHARLAGVLRTTRHPIRSGWQRRRDRRDLVRRVECAGAVVGLPLRRNQLRPPRHRLHRHTWRSPDRWERAER